MSDILMDREVFDTSEVSPVRGRCSVWGAYTHAYTMVRIHMTCARAHLRMSSVYTERAHTRMTYRPYTSMRYTVRVDNG